MISVRGSSKEITLGTNPGTDLTTSKIEHFVIIINGLKPLTIITKSSILDVAAVLDPSLQPLRATGININNNRIKYRHTHATNQIQTYSCYCYRYLFFHQRAWILDPNKFVKERLQN